MALLTKYKIWCNTENVWRYVTQETPPTECPVGSDHVVDFNKISIIETGILEYTEDGYIVYETGESLNTIAEVEDYIEAHPRDRIVTSLVSNVEVVEENIANDYIVYDLISDAKNKRNRTIAPQDIDYNILGFKKERIFDKGFLITVKFWKEYDAINSVYTGLAVQEDNAYHREIGGIGKLIKRIKSIKWYTNNVVPATEKITTKYYSMLEGANADYRARTYIVDDIKYQAIGLLMATEGVDELTAFGMGMPFVSELSTEMQQFRDGDRQLLIDKFANYDTVGGTIHGWLDNNTGISNLLGGTFTIREYVIDYITA